MPGIADSNVQRIAPAGSANFAAEQSVTPAVGDLMKAFRDGFITVDDIAKRSADKPLENAQRQQALQDTNIIRPKQRDVAAQQLDIQSQSLGTQAQAQPKMDEAALLQAENILTKARQGDDKNAILNFYQSVAAPGQLPPRLNDDPNSGYDFAKIEEANKTFLNQQRQLQSAGALGKFVKTFQSKTTDATGKETESVVRINELTGEKLGSTVLGETPKQKTPLPAQTAKDVSQVNQAIGAVDNVGKAFEALVARNPELVGPVAGRTISPAIGEYNELYKTLEAAVTQTVPNLARGVFQEVGVLTDEDVNRYKALLPTAKTDPTVARALLRELSRTVRGAREQLFDVLEDNNHDMSAFRKRASADASATASTAAPAASNQPVAVNHPSEAPATAQFIKAPDGRVFKNPNYVAPR